MNEIIEMFIVAVIILLLAVLMPILWVFLKREGYPDKVVALDASSSIIVSVLVMFSLFKDSALYIDAALVLGALSFLGTVSLSKYLIKGEVF